MTFSDHPDRKDLAGGLPFLGFDPEYHRYPSRRAVLYASRGMVCTAHPLAAQAGLEILKKGGNAVDAAVATAAALTVVEPTSNGLGSDAFALVWKDGRFQGLNASGPSPQGLSFDVARRGGWKAVPPQGWAPVTVPGAPAAWAELTARMGRLSLRENLAPAVAYAREGHAISVTVGRCMAESFQRYARESGELFAPWFETFAPAGRPLRIGERWASLAHAETLERIGESDARDFYRGELAERMAAHARRTGGFLTLDDLGTFAPEWVEPLHVSYKGFDVWEMPPNGQGLVALLALSILREFSFPDHDDPLTVHRQVEAIKMAFADAHRHVADPRWAPVPVAELLSEEYLRSRRALLSPEARDFQAGNPLPGGTVYLCTADGEGTMVSYIQSNYMGFGSGVVIPGTGIALNNRGHCFSLTPGHPNVLAPGKRPYNTIIPGFLTRHGEALGPFGVMGGFMQPQGHVQVVMNTVDFGMNPQEALDAPRWQWMGGMKLSVEPGFPSALAQALARRGHAVTCERESSSFGRGEIIWRTEEGTLAGATEPRADGGVAPW